MAKLPGLFLVTVGGSESPLALLVAWCSHRRICSVACLAQANMSPVTPHPDADHKEWLSWGIEWESLKL